MMNPKTSLAQKYNMKLVPFNHWKTVVPRPTKGGLRQSFILNLPKHSSLSILQFYNLKTKIQTLEAFVNADGYCGIRALYSGGACSKSQVCRNVYVILITSQLVQLNSQKIVQIGIEEHMGMRQIEVLIIASKWAKLMRIQFNNVIEGHCNILQKSKPRQIISNDRWNKITSLQFSWQKSIFKTTLEIKWDWKQQKQNIQQKLFKQQFMKQLNLDQNIRKQVMNNSILNKKMLCLIISQICRANNNIQKDIQTIEKYQKFQQKLNNQRKKKIFLFIQHCSSLRKTNETVQINDKSSNIFLNVLHETSEEIIIKLVQNPNKYLIYENEKYVKSSRCQLRALIKASVFSEIINVLSQKLFKNQSLISIQNILKPPVKQQYQPLFSLIIKVIVFKHIMQTIGYDPKIQYNNFKLNHVYFINSCIQNRKQELLKRLIVIKFPIIDINLKNPEFKIIQWIKQCWQDFVVRQKQNQLEMSIQSNVTNQNSEPFSMHTLQFSGCQNINNKIQSDYSSTNNLTKDKVNKINQFKKEYHQILQSMREKEILLKSEIQTITNASIFSHNDIDVYFSNDTISQISMYQNQFYEQNQFTLQHCLQNLGFLQTN